MRRGRYRSDKRQRKFTARLFLTLLAFLLLAGLLVGATSLIKADRLMKRPSEPISPYATNSLPPFRSVTISSDEGELSLKGWLIASGKDRNRGTVILVHDQGGNRLPFGLDTAPLLKHLSREGFQVLAFDLRHSGDSDGGLSSFGYAEAEDVIAAIDWVVDNLPSSPLILFGFGSGSSASLRALGQLDAESRQETEEEGHFSRIAALLVDSPARDSDAFIRASLRSETNKLFFWLPETMPYAVRLSVGNPDKQDHFSYFSSLTLPVLILGHERDSLLKESDYRPMIEERIRLLPERTKSHLLPGSGHLSSYLEDREAYLEALTAFLNRWFPETD